jgi:hypothetical protein
MNSQQVTWPPLQAIDHLGSILFMGLTLKFILLNVWIGRVHQDNKRCC